MYAYIIYAFAAHFNSLFLVYVTIPGLCFYTLVSAMIRLPLDRLRPVFAAITRARLVSTFLLALGILFYILWLSEDIPAILSGKIPQSVLENGLLTNPVHVLDIGIYLPAMIITAILLWRRKLLGYLLSVPMLVFSILTGMGILAIDLVSGIKGLSVSPGVDLFIATIVLVSGVLSVLFAHEMQEQRDVSLV